MCTFNNEKETVEFKNIGTLLAFIMILGLIFVAPQTIKADFVNPCPGFEGCNDPWQIVTIVETPDGCPGCEWNIIIHHRRCPDGTVEFFIKAAWPTYWAVDACFACYTDIPSRVAIAAKLAQDWLVDTYGLGINGLIRSFMASCWQELEYGPYEPRLFACDDSECCYYKYRVIATSPEPIYFLDVIVMPPGGQPHCDVVSDPGPCILACNPLGYHTSHKTTDFNLFDDEMFNTLIYPNPANSELTIESFHDNSIPAGIMIVNTKGTIVLMQVNAFQKGVESIQLNTEHYESGKYFFFVVTDAMEIVSKGHFIIVK